MTRTLSSGFDGRPSNSTRNSDLRRRLASCSPSRLSDNSESTSSMKIMDGWNQQSPSKCEQSIIFSLIFCGRQWLLLQALH
jgi:hypothetical protein